MTYTWTRFQETNPNYNQGWSLMAAVPSGETIRRIRWSWGFSGTTSDVVDMNAVGENCEVVGLVTTVGNGSEIPPSPVSASGDAAPPTQRWLWWEMRQPVPIAVSHDAGVVFWRDSGPQEIPDVQSQVLATGIPGGDNLNLWFRWQSQSGGAWDPSGFVNLFVVASILTSTP